MKNCLIITGGKFCEPEKSAVQSAEFVIACDRGADYAKRLGITPHLIM